MRVLTDDGSMVLNIKEHVRDGVRSPYVYKMALMISESPYHLVDEFVWHKTNPFPTGSKKRLKDGWERCFHITKKLDYKFNPKAVSAPSTSKYANDSARRKNKGAHSVNNGSGMNMSKRVVVDKVRPSNVISGSSSNLNIGHPAAFPEYLPEFFIKLLTDPGDRVLDPFVGSGTTALAALNLGRSVIGIDSNIDYVDLARERISKIGTLV
jgi:DNA modification methylase